MFDGKAAFFFVLTPSRRQVRGDWDKHCLAASYQVEPGILIAYKQGATSGQVLRVLVLQLRQQGQPESGGVQVSSGNSVGAPNRGRFSRLYPLMITDADDSLNS
jgi:hypothetical protein